MKGAAVLVPATAGCWKQLRESPYEPRVHRRTHPDSARIGRTGARLSARATVQWLSICTKPLLPTPSASPVAPALARSGRTTREAKGTHAVFAVESRSSVSPRRPRPGLAPRRRQCTLDDRKTPHRFCQHLLTPCREFVVTPSRPLLPFCHCVAFPASFEQTLFGEAAECRIYGSTRKAGHIHDVEAVDVTICNRLQNQDR
jgi:hypothetical protein